MKLKPIPLIMSIILCLMSCELPNQPGPMPKEIIDLDFEPGLNILGVLRKEADKTQSFIYIEEALKTKDYYQYETVPIVSSAEVFVFDSRDSTFQFKIMESIDTSRYTNLNFVPKELESYSLNISAATKNGDLAIYAEAKVPETPMVDTTTIDIDDKYITFDLLTSASSFRYDCILIFSEDYITQTIQINESAVRSILLPIPDDYGRVQQVKIVAYDENLTKYLGASSTIIPQTYQESISTVNGGYGCFGAISIKSISMK